MPDRPREVCQCDIEQCSACAMKVLAQDHICPKCGNHTVRERPLPDRFTEYFYYGAIQSLHTRRKI